MNLSWLLLADANARWVLAGSMLLGLSAGVLGSFALLKRRSLMGDTLAHAALPGVCLAFLLTGGKSIGLFLVGAAVAGGLGALSVHAITRWTKIKEDTALGLVLTFFFAIGIMLLTMIQKLPGGNQSGLDKFLFGQAAAMVGSDVQVMTAIAGALCLAVFLLFKEFKLLAFDPGFARGLGLPVWSLDNLLNLLILLAVVIGLQAVGVVLMAAMLITPAIAARYWTNRLSLMVTLAGLFGAISGALGTLVSQAGPRMPTGPLIVLAATAVFLVSMLFAPNRGLLAKGLRLLQLRRRVTRHDALRAVYELAEERENAETTIAAAELGSRRSVKQAALRQLAAGGLLTEAAGGWRLTAEGLAEAHRLVRQQRLWEVFLMHEGELGGQPVDREAPTPVFPAELARELEQRLKLHGLEPLLVPAKEGA